MSESIVKLTDWQHTRLRIEMYYGSRDPVSKTIMTYDDKGVASVIDGTWIPATFTAFREILDNALDEVVGHGYGDRIDVEFDENTNIISVKDNGRGIPIEYSEEYGQHFATLSMSQARAGRNFGDRGRVGGTNGIGASGVNFCSEYFKLDIHRDNKHFTQMFNEGEDQLIINEPKIKDIKSTTTGTRIEFKLSNTVFKQIMLTEKFIYDRLYEVALCNPKLKLYYNSKRITPKTMDKGLFGKTKPIYFNIDEPHFESEFWLVPEFIENNEHAHTMVNNIPAFDGGVHIDAFKRHFYSGLITALERESKKRKLKPNRSDISDGILIYNITKMDAPNFGSQSKTSLQNEETAKLVRTLLDNQDFFKGIIAKNKEWIDAIFERCAERTMKKDASELGREAKKMLREKVPSLTDATGKDRSKCILLLAEGECMAASTMVRKMGNNEYVDVKANDLEIDDLVLTHQNRLRAVTSVHKKVASTFSIKTQHGVERFTADHRLLTYNKETKLFGFEIVGDLDKNAHQLVKNKLVDYSKIAIIESVDTRSKEDADKDGFELVLNFGDDVILTTAKHKFAVIDRNDMQYLMLEAESINPNIHWFVVN